LSIFKNRKNIFTTKTIFLKNYEGEAAFVFFFSLPREGKRVMISIHSWNEELHWCSRSSGRILVTIGSLGGSIVYHKEL
jgi:hypothetical protein